MYTHPAIKTPVPSARLGKITSFALAYMVLGSCCPQNASLYPMPQTKNIIPAIRTPNFITPSRIPSNQSGGSRHVMTAAISVQMI